MSPLHRRNFLQQMITAPLAALALPALANDRSVWDASFDPADESFWDAFQKQFAVPSNKVMLNAANLCPSPWFINEMVTEMQKALGKDVSFQFRAQFAARRAQSLEKLAGYLGVGKDEVGIVRNTSEANSLLVAGIDLKAGDEVILWDQNHPSNMATWEQRARRVGFTVKKVSVPAEAQQELDLLAPFASAITPKTKIIAFSHISNLTGIALPAKAICTLARSRNIMTLLDGAQSFGALNLNLAELGCDFYTASTHKWLMGPFENGVLYVRRDQLDRVWPATIGAGWKDGMKTTDEKLCVLGQRVEITTVALPEILDMHLAMGKDVVEARVRRLSSKLREGITEKIPSVVFNSPKTPACNAGIVSVKFGGKPAGDLAQRLYADHGIAAAAVGDGLRLSPHIYNTRNDLEKVVASLSSLVNG